MQRISDMKLEDVAPLCHDTVAAANTRRRAVLDDAHILRSTTNPMQTDVARSAATLAKSVVRVVTGATVQCEATVASATSRGVTGVTASGNIG